MRSHHPPRFHELAADRFEKLCSELLQLDPQIQQSSVYGTRGQFQGGVDLRAIEREGNGIHVGQCKCYHRVTKAQLRKWSDNFFTHWDYWSKHNVRRFVLYIACDADRTELVEARDQEAARFRERGIQYELYDAAQIATALAAHPQIVQRYLGADWVKYLCGSMPALALRREPASVVLPESSNVEEVLARLGEHSRAIIESALETWRQGHRDEAETQLIALRDDPVQWESLGSAGRGRVLRTLARIALDRSQLPLARQLQGQAQAIDETDDAGLEALLLRHEAGAEAALAWIDSQPDSPGNFRAALQLELGQTQAARATLEGLAGSDDAETYRLRALVQLASGEIEAAHAAITEALTQKPGWVALRFMAAVLQYFRACSPAARPTYLVAWPAPVPWVFVQRDTESLSALDQAAAEFAALAVLANDQPTRRTFLLWQAAATINHPDRQTEALALFETLLREDPSDHRAWIWALARNVPVNHRRSARALGLAVGDGTATTPQVVALLNYHLTTNALGKARRLLSDTRILFRQAGERELWSVWTEALKAVDRARSPLPGRSAIEATSLQRQATLEVLSQRAHRSGDYVDVVAYLRDCFEATDDGAYLAALCQLLMRLQRWQELSAYARVLVERVGTAEAVYIAVVGAFNARDPYTALTLLNEGRGCFREDELPPDLERLFITALHLTGQSQDALRLARSLADRDPSTPNLLTLLDLHAQRGDVAAVSTVAQQVLDRGDVAADQALYISHLLRSHHVQAKRFLRAAMDAGIPDDLVGRAVGLANALGLPVDDPVITGLMRRLIELGHRAEGEVRIVTLEEIRTLLQEINVQHVEMERLYRSAQIPLHLLERYLPGLLVRCYHSLLDANAATEGKGQAALFMRSGSRGLPLPPPDIDSPPRLHMDVSSLLLAHHFGLLDHIQHVFTSVRIPPEAPGTLLDLWNALQHHQPQRLEDHRRVVEAVTKGHLTPLLIENTDDWHEVLQVVAGEPGWALAFGSHLPAQRGLGAGDIVDILVGAGELAAVNAEQARIALGVEANARTGARPPRRSALFCHSGLAELLASAGLLTAANRYFRVFLPASNLERLKSELEAETLRQQDAKWLDELLERIVAGLAENTFEFTPSVAARLPDDTREPHTNAESGLLTLMAVPVEPADLIWIDDRFVSRYIRRDQAQLVGLFDMVAWLHAWSEIGEAHYYDLLHRMREANLRHLPLLPQEILYHLGRAPVAEGDIIETPELRVLRRYYAQGLIQPGQLQRPEPPSHHGELEWILSGRKAVADALAGLWRADGPERDARAAWILDHLYYETVDVATVFGLAEPRDPTELAAIWYLDLALVALDRTSLSYEQRRDFLRWLDRHILEPRFHQSPVLGDAVANAARGLLNQIANEPEASEQRQTILEYSLIRLPDSIHRVVLADQNWVEATGIRIVERLMVGGGAFATTEFWDALAEACAGGTAELTELQSGRTVIFGPVAPGRGGWRFADDMDAPKVLDEAYLVLVAPDSEARERYLRAHRDWFDIVTPLFEEVLADIQGTDDPSQRVEKAATWWSQSATYYYRNLALSLAERHPVQERELIPPLASVLRSLGLEGARTLARFDSETYREAATTLLEREGLELTVQRLWGLPVSLPRPIHLAIAELPEPQRREMLERLLSAASSPLAHLHLLHLLQLEPASPWKDGHSRELFARVTSRQAYEALQELTRFAIWSSVQVEALEADWSLPARLAVAWTHAHNLYAHFDHAELDISKVTQWLLGRLPLASHALRRASERVWDVAHPGMVEPAALLVGGLSHDSAPGYDTAIADWVEESPVDPVWVTALRHWWFRNLTDLPDHLDSWMSSDAGPVWPMLVTPDTLENWQALAAALSTERIFEHLPNAPGDPQPWFGLWLHRGFNPAPRRWNDALRTATLALTLPDVPEVVRDTMLLEIAAHLLRGDPEGAVQAHLLGQWEGLVERLGDQELSDAEVGHLFLSAATICTLASSSRELHSRLAQSLKKLARLPLVPYLRNLAIRLRTGLPPSASQFYDAALAYLNTY